VSRVDVGLSIYLMHRVGAIIGFTAGCLFLAFLTENQPILNGPVGKAYFFWAWGLIVAIAPLIMVLPKRDSAVFLLLGLPIVGVCGAVTFLLPEEVWIDVVPLIMLGFVLALARLSKSKKVRLLDMRPRVSPYMFAESLVLFAMSWVCASALQLVGVFSGLISSSPVAVNLLLWAAFFVALSLIAIVAHVVKRR
jgi:hypothetical protein